MSTTAMKNHHGMSALRRKEAVTGYLFAAPWIIGFFVFTLYPVASSLFYSFTNYSVTGAYKWLGFKNYVVMFTNDHLFPKAVYNTLYYALFSVPLNLVIGLCVALLMNQKIRGINVIRTIYYLPNVVSGVAVCMLWSMILQSKYGVLNQILAVFGITGPAWLSDPNWTKPALIIMSCWNSGGAMVIYLAALQGIPKTYYEAVEIDGANVFQKFWHITVPMLSPTIFFQLINGIIGAMQVFTQAYLMTGTGPSYSTTFYVYALYNKAFTDRRMGYASAMSWVLVIFVLLLTLFMFKVVGRKVYYESGDSK
mgnify:FL=1